MTKFSYNSPKYLLQNQRAIKLWPWYAESGMYALKHTRLEPNYFSVNLALGKRKTCVETKNA